MIPELAVNPLSSRILSLLDKKHHGLINFKDFISFLNMFHESKKCGVLTEKKKMNRNQNVSLSFL
jgi:hypothetical protein